MTVGSKSRVTQIVAAGLALGWLMVATGGAAEARSEHWALQPLKSPTVPVISKTVIVNQSGRRGSASLITDSLITSPSSPIDAFILARLSTNGLALAPGADRATLIRRLSFDLLGLPPTPREIDKFVRDKSPRAYEQLVERLLASPRYGERWGRHWLDVARYTESQGFEYDRLRDNAWHYRDYVIKSFNDDKPYDQFMREQIAGDAMEPVTRDGLIAPSLLVCGPWDEAGNGQANKTQKAITREEELEDMISVVSQTFLGLTVNCARCHDHKFDPIPQAEYYRFKSVFEGVKHGERAIATPGEAKEREERVAKLKSEIAAVEQSITNLTGAPREAAVTRINELRREMKAVPMLPVSYAGTRVQPAPTARLKRGDVKQPQEIVTAGGLAAVAELNSDFGLPADAPEAQRRLKFAEWLTDKHNPLPARVMANRVWHFHFGQGLVATPNDFGVSGARPSHPELLDWLAVKFIESGWSVKALHRLIVHSATYRQGGEGKVISKTVISNQSAKGVASLITDSLITDYFQRASSLDADNQLLWRYPPRRLEAEALRDAMLAVSGEINWQMGGPSFRPFTVVKFNSSFYEPKDFPGPEFNRRTVYRINVQSGKEPLLDAFDCPDPSVKTPRRGTTTTPLQALALMNNSFVQRQADKLAARALAETKGDTTKAIHAAYRHALGREATRDELKRAKEHGLPHVCWALLNSTEFVYVR